jgi:hypothetical protein
MKYSVIEDSFSFNVETGKIEVSISNNERDYYISAVYNLNSDQVDIEQVFNNDDGLPISVNKTQLYNYSQLIKEYFINIDDFYYLIKEYESNCIIDNEDYKQYMLEEYKTGN